MTAADEEALKQTIVEAVEQHWTEHKSAMLLTSVGIQVRKQFQNADDLMPSGLRAFIEKSGIAKVVGHPTQSAKIGAIPLTAHIPENVADIFVNPQASSVSANSSGRPPLRQEFWNAFHQPLNGMRRFVVVFNGDVTIRNLASPPEEGQYYEITQDDIALNDGNTHISELVDRNWQKIRGWLDRNHLDVTPFLRPDRSISNIPERHHPDLTFFSKLDRADQARIMVPLDLVLKLLSVQ